MGRMRQRGISAVAPVNPKKQDRRGVRGVHPISGGMPALKAGMFPRGGFMAAREAAMPPE